MGRACIEDFLKGFDDSAYPDSFLETYEVMECLAENLNVDTFLVRHRQAGELRIAKCCGDTALTSEVNLLKTLRHDALPRFIEEHINENMRCSVYEYIQGIQLGSLCDERPLDEKSIISIMTQLCDVLIYLHGQAQPIIHRDIKPQNIIVEDSGKVRLIDFGISRVYDESALKDTVYAGTLNLAPPEQFGFSQTDCRSIFIRWVLLRGGSHGKYGRP
jgi:serine/threonine protein kinase